MRSLSSVLIILEIETNPEDTFFQVPPGLILAPEELLCSSLLQEIVQFGKDYLKGISDGANETSSGGEQAEELQSISDNIKTSEFSETLEIDLNKN